MAPPLLPFAIGFYCRSHRSGTSKPTMPWGARACSSAGLMSRSVVASSINLSCSVMSIFTQVQLAEHLFLCAMLVPRPLAASRPKPLRLVAHQPGTRLLARDTLAWPCWRSSAHRLWQLLLCLTAATDSIVDCAKLW